jgi:hypothetical protein
MQCRRLAFVLGTLLLAACGSSGNGTTGTGGSGGGATGTGGSNGTSSSSSSSSSSGAGGAGADCTGIDASFAAVLSKPLSSCSGHEPPCHNLAAGNLHIDATDPAGTWAALVNVTASTAGAGKLVVPGDPIHSFLYRKLIDDITADEGDPMPKPGSLAGAMWNELPQDEIDTLRCWIAAGAPKD